MLGLKYWSWNTGTEILVLEYWDGMSVLEYWDGMSVLEYWD